MPPEVFSRNHQPTSTSEIEIVRSLNPPHPSPLPQGERGQGSHPLSSRANKPIQPSSPTKPKPPSVCHRLPAGARLGLAFGVVLAAVLTPPEFWPLSGVLGCLIFAGQTLANIPLRYLARRLVIFVPPVMLAAISFPMSQGFQTGWSMSVAILLRSTLALMAGIWLVQVLPFEELLLALRRYKLPMVLITTLAFAYRYVFVLWDELDKMRTARQARTFGNPGLWSRWKTSAQLLGMLLLRALSRAERVHGAMCARGWDGQIRTLDESKVQGQGSRAGKC